MVGTGSHGQQATLSARQWPRCGLKLVLGEKRHFFWRFVFHFVAAIFFLSLFILRLILLALRNFNCSRSFIFVYLR